jgi:predicted PhzF superfamily epimerase YddE/YHI9
MGIAIYQVDTFAEKPFRGNPAAVCILLEPECTHIVGDGFAG